MMNVTSSSSVRSVLKLMILVVVEDEFLVRGLPPSAPAMPRHICWREAKESGSIIVVDVTLDSDAY